MSSERWKLIEKIYHDALEREPETRAAFLNQACGEDSELQREVAELLSFDEKGANFIASPALEVAARNLATNARSENRSAPPAQIASYQVLRPLGKGGMGEVHLAIDPRLGRKVAIKLLPAEFTQDASRVHRFEREARTASSLNHPNIVTVHEIGISNDLHYLVTEYIEGQTLRERMSARTLKLSETIDVALQIASALSGAHAAGIIHRDIKPENVMLRPDGLVKVLDFGLAKLEGPQQAINTATMPGMVLGTVTYMSPEQAKGSSVDSRTDLWSLGAVLYEMVSGHPPFAGETDTETISLILQTEPAPLTSDGRGVSSELTRIISMALTKNREARYQTAASLIADLRSLKRRLETTDEADNVIIPALANEPESTSGRGFRNTDRESASTGATGAVPVTQTSWADVVGAIRHHKLIAAVIIAFILGGLSLIAYLKSRSEEAAIESIAVLPFDNQNHDPDTEYLSDGLTESIINSLTQLQQLRVVARSSVFRYKGKEVDPLKVGKDLGVRSILTGRLLQRAESLRISVELIDVSNNKQLWGEHYDRKFSEMVNVQRDIGREITENLRLRLSGSDQSKVNRQYTANPEAFQLYLKGRFYWNKRTGESIKKSVDYFQQAIEKDPNYALAYVGLADSYIIFPGFSVAPGTECFPKAESAARRALEIDEMLAEAHTSLAHVLVHYKRDFPKAEREFRRAIELNDKYATAHHWYANIYLLAVGRFDEAVSEMKRAQELDPLSLIINADLGQTYLYARRYDEAIEQLQRTLEIDENFYYAHLLLGLAYEMKGRFQDAIAEELKARQLNDDPRVLSMLGHIYALSGQRESALKILKELKDTAGQRYVGGVMFGAIYAGLGEKDEAFRWLETSYQHYDPRMTKLSVDPLFANLHNDSRFADLLRRMRIPV